MAESKIEQTKNKIAVLIDGDNAQPTLIEKLLAEAGKYGTVTIRRIYGDWTTPSMKGWKNNLNNHAIQPIQQFRYTVGKNATDSALIIDAMDILHSDLVEGFCIVSSDSDYTRLATRIRETGIFVMGIGEKKTPKAFVNACKVFVYTENLIAKKPSTIAKTEQKKGDSIEGLTQMLKTAYNMSTGDEVWINLGVMGTNLRKLDPAFDPRTYGFEKLVDLLKNFQEIFNIKYVGDPPNAVIKLK